MSNLLDKHDRAVRANISDAVKGCNAAIQIQIRNDARERKTVVDGQNVGMVEVDSLLGSENPKGSGNYDVTVMVRVKFPAATQPDQGEEDNRALLAALQTAVNNRLHLTNNSQDYHATAQAITDAGNALAVDASNGTVEGETARAEANADMINYSCLAISHTTVNGGKNKQDEQDLNFYELINFTANVAGYNGYWN